MSAGGSRYTGARFMADWIQKLKRSSRTFYVSMVVGAVVGVGLVDYATGWELSFSVFYLFIVALAAWFVGKKFAFSISVLSVAVSLGGDLVKGAPFSNRFVPWWNAFIELASLIVVVWLSTRLSTLYGELESRVKQRTAALTNEMEERERIERELLEISEREQRRIGHDLHDSLGQHLTGTALAAQVLEEKLATRAQPEAADASKIVELTEEGIVLTRKLAKGLHPLEMEAEGLMQALEELAATSSELFKVSCQFECDSPVLVKESTTATHLYRIAQESVSNAVKHGKARNILIQLEVVDDGIVLRIKDDGIGLPSPLPEKRGLGLRIMAHRANMIRANFSIGREPSGGTSVTCLLRHDNRSEKSAYD